MSALEPDAFRELEAALTEATAAIAAAREVERAAYAVLDAARCNKDFGPGPRGGMWRCTLQAGHTEDCSNVFSRGERAA